MHADGARQYTTADTAAVMRTGTPSTTSSPSKTLSRSAREPVVAGAPSVPGTRAAFAVARNIAGRPARRRGPCNPARPAPRATGSVQWALQGSRPPTGCIPPPLDARTADQGLFPPPTLGPPGRRFAQGPNWPRANCFSVAMSAPDLHLKARPSTEQAERFADRCTPRGWRKAVRPQTLATWYLAARFTCQVSHLSGSTQCVLILSGVLLNMAA